MVTGSPPESPSPPLLTFQLGDHLTLIHRLTGQTLRLIAEPRGAGGLQCLIARPEAPYHRLHCALYKDSVTWKPTNGNALVCTAPTPADRKSCAGRHCGKRSEWRVQCGCGARIGGSD